MSQCWVVDLICDQRKLQVVSPVLLHVTFLSDLGHSDQALSTVRNDSSKIRSALERLQRLGIDLRKMFADIVPVLMGIPNVMYRVRGEGFDAVIEPHGIPMMPTHADYGVAEYLCSLATSYYRILYFIRKYCDGEVNGVEVAEDYSLYYGPCAQALVGILEPYREAILQLERECCKPGFQSFIQIFNAVQPYETLLRCLHNLCYEMNSLETPGCNILNLIEKYRDAGNPEMKDVCSRLIEPCRVPFLQNLCAWVLKARGPALVNDFFIGGPDVGLCLPGSSKPRHGDRKSWTDRKDLESAVDGRRSDTSSRRKSKNGSEEGGSHAAVPICADLVDNFKARAPDLTLIPTQVPYFVSIRLAETVTHMAKNLKLLQIFSCDRHTDHFILVNRHHRAMLKSLMDLNEEHEIEFFQQKLKDWVHCAKNVIDRQMVNMVIEDGRLVETSLTLIKEYVLMGYGEFNAEFIKGMSNVLERRRNTDDIAFLQTRIDTCLADVLWDLHIDEIPRDVDYLAADKNGQPLEDLDDEKKRARLRQYYKEFLQNMEDRGERPAVKKPAKVNETWTIDIIIHLPNTLIVTEELMANKYRPVYNVVSKVRMASNALHCLWFRRAKSGIVERRRHEDICMLMEMMYLVRNVLAFAEWHFEDQYSILLEKIRECYENTENGSLDILQYHHEQFALSVGTFANEAFLKIMNRVLDACNAYCRCLADTPDGYPTPGLYPRCSKIEQTFALSVAQFMQYSLILNRQNVETSLKEMSYMLCANSHIVGKYASEAAELLGVTCSWRLQR